MRLRFILWFLSLCFIFPSQASAYLDPGTGSMILQAIGAVIVTCLVFFQGLRQRIISFFKRGKKDDTTLDDE